MNERCEGITAAGEQCRCWATQKVNEVPYCDQHATKELRALAEMERNAAGLTGRAGDAGKVGM